MFLKSKAVMKDKNKKSFLRIMKDVTTIAISRRCIPTYYFSDFIYRRDAANHLDYITNDEARKICRSMHSPATYQVLDNKLLQHEHFSRLGINMPKKIAYNYNHLWFIEKTEGLVKEEIKSIDQFISLLRTLFIDIGCSDFFAKPIISYGGMGAIKIPREVFFKSQWENVASLFHYVNSGCFIIQENVIQHPEMSRLNASSVNTIRVATFNSLRSSPELIAAFLRIGRSGSIVDNIMSGGLFIGIELDSGKLDGNAFTELEYGGRVYSKHPDSGIEFKGFTIPNFSDVKEMACQAANCISSKLIGWDIAVTTNGPILIEGNHWLHLGIQDIAYGGLRRNAVFEKVMIEAGIRI
jgi:hypothetical protein